MTTKHRFITAITAAIAILITMAACTKGTLYHRFMSTPVAGWEKNDSLVFGIPKVKEHGLYRQELLLRTTGTYPFTSITLIVKQHKTPGGTTETQTVKCPLTDKNGNMNGHGVSAYQYKFDVRDIEVKPGDSLTVCIRHDMKREILPGISDVGIKMTRLR